MYFHMYFHTQVSALVILTNACSQTPCFWQGLEDPLSEKRIIWVNQPYSDGERRYPIITPIGPFIFCLHSRETEACEGTNQIALCNNLQLWINHTNFTETDRYFTSNSHVHFLSCSSSLCQHAYLCDEAPHLPHRGNKKAWRFLHLSGNHKNVSTTSNTGEKKHNLTTTATVLCLHKYTQVCIQNVPLLPCFKI